MNGLIFIASVIYLIIGIAVLCKWWSMCNNIESMSKSLKKLANFNNVKDEKIEENSSPKVADEYVNELGDFKVGDFVRNKGRKYEIISILKGADKPYICNLTGMFSVGTKYFDATEIEKV